MNLPQHITYGLIVFAAIFAIGWLTGMGGSFLPNLLFSAAMGVFASFCFVMARRIGGRK